MSGAASFFLCITTTENKQKILDSFWTDGNNGPLFFGRAVLRHRYYCRKLTIRQSIGTSCSMCNCPAFIGALAESVPNGLFVGTG